MGISFFFSFPTGLWKLPFFPSSWCGDDDFPQKLEDIKMQMFSSSCVNFLDSRCVNIQMEPSPWSLETLDWRQWWKALCTLSVGHPPMWLQKSLQRQGEHDCLQLRPGNHSLLARCKIYMLQKLSLYHFVTKPPVGTTLSSSKRAVSLLSLLL